MIGDVDPRVLLDAGVTGWVILLAFGASLGAALLGGILALFGPLSGRSREPEMAWGASAVFLAMGVLESVAFCWRAGQSILHAMDAADFRETWDIAIERTESTYLTVGIAVFSASICVAIGVGVRAFRARKEAVRPGWLVPISCALVLASAAAAILLRASFARNPYRGAALAGWEAVWLVRRAAIVLPNARLVVIGVALAASVAVLIHAIVRDPRASASTRSRRGPLTVALLGISAWIGVRPLAHDGEHPFEFPENAFAYHHCPTPLRTDPDALPRMAGSGKPCMDFASEDFIPLALLDADASGATADGRPLREPVEAFWYVNSQRLLRDAGNPPGHWSVILIAAPASLPAEQLGPWLGAINNSNQRFAVVVLHEQPPLASATAGILPRGERCSCPRISLAPDGMSLRGQRWGDVVRQATQSSEEAPLVLNPGYSLREEAGAFIVAPDEPK